MNDPIEVHRGSTALHDLLTRHLHDLRPVDLAGFRNWLDTHTRFWSSRADFVQRQKIRDLRAGCPQLAEAESRRRRLDTARQGQAILASWRQLIFEIDGADRGCAGLTTAIEAATPERRLALIKKRQTVEQHRDQLFARREQMTRTDPMIQELVTLDRTILELRDRLGLPAEEELLQSMTRARGRLSGHAGDSFESLAVNVTRQHVFPDLHGDHSAFHLLTGVTLGASVVEFDHLVVESRSDGPVIVRAIVEVKRNINDLAHGVQRRRQDLAWCQGDTSAYDPNEYQCGRFPTGHFDRPAIHDEPDTAFRFSRESFTETQLYLITRPGPLWGISTRMLSRIEHRVATDENWRPDDDEFMSRFFNWCRSLTDAVETPDVLAGMAEHPEEARRVLLVGPDRA